MDNLLYGVNHSYNACKNSFLFADYIINFHLNRLYAKAGDTTVDDIILFFDPYALAWNNSFVGWRNIYNLKKGATKTLNNALDNVIKVKAPYWVNQVYNFHPEHSPEADAIIPHKRQPFITGNVNERLKGMLTFAEAIKNDANLGAVHTDVQAVYQVVNNAYKAQQKAIEDLADLSDDLNTLRKTTTSAMLANEGSLIKKYFLTPEKIDHFFAVNKMRQRYGKKDEDEDIVDTKLSPSEIALMDVRFTGDEILEVTNKSQHDAAFFFSDTSTVTAIPTDRTLLHSGETADVDLKTIDPSKRFLFGANFSSVDDAELSAKLK